MKKLLTLLLCAVMLITSAMIPTPAFAAEYTPEEQEAAEQLFQYINPDDKRVTDVYNAYKAGDYRKALKRLKRFPDDRYALGEKSSIERFFHSTWFGTLTTVDGDVLIQGISARVRKEGAA